MLEEIMEDPSITPGLFAEAFMLYNMLGCNGPPNNPQHPDNPWNLNDPKPIDLRSNRSQCPSWFQPMPISGLVIGLPPGGPLQIPPQAVGWSFGTYILIEIGKGLILVPAL
jgi:hypothetical protein